MATFPALKPSSRTFTPGVRPHSVIGTLNGNNIRVRQSNVLVNQRLRLTFVALTEAEMLSIRTHYTGQQGRFLSFGIPNDLLSGVTTPASFTPTGYSWVYAATPQVEDVGCSRYTVAVELITVPPEGANVNGAELTVTTTFAAGIGSAFVNNAGFDLTVTTSFEAGEVGGDVTTGTSGFDLTVTASLVSGAPSETDPDFASVSLLLHMDGTNGSTTFTDSSANSLTVTVTGNAQVSTAQSKFGGASGLFDGNGDWLGVANNAAFQFGTGDFTVEAWIYASALTANFPSIIANGNATFTGSGSTGACFIMVSGSPRKVNFGTNTTNPIASSTTTIATSQWYHIAVTRSGSTVRLFVDGNLEATATNSQNINLSNNGLQIGRNGWDGTAGHWNGYIDDLRITKGVARYTTSFTAPLAPFPNT